MLTEEALVERALTYCDWAVAKGLLAIRSHVDTSDPSLLPVRAMLEVKNRVAPYLDLQLVAFPQDGVLRTPGALDNLQRALDLGVDVVGGIPHFERTMGDGAASVCCASWRPSGLPVDMHCDEGDDPSRATSRRWPWRQRLGLQGRVTGSHLTSMHSMDNYYASKLIPLIAEAGWRGGQPAHQHHLAGPPRHLPQAPRHDAGARAAGRGCHGRVRPRLRDGPWYYWAAATCWRWRTWACTWRR
jgi:cytosine deaminase